ncbi:hypothetical protein [Gorillibacterium sp. sgz5001074]|uniref:hypothetical protein n=1 Tax=Gorillibacterium sp. sgz5001074 TaxID=3446695 RepID=UPI003F66870C
MNIQKYEPQFKPIQCFITRFFEGGNLIFEQETERALPTLDPGDNIVIFDKEYVIKRRRFGFNEDAFVTVYEIE